MGLGHQIDTGTLTTAVSPKAVSEVQTQRAGGHELDLRYGCRHRFHRYVVS